MRSLFCRLALAVALLLPGAAVSFAQQAAGSETAKAAKATKPTKDERRLEAEAKRIDREATTSQGETRVLSQMSTELGIPVDTLKQQKQSSDLSYGNLFIANSLAKASGITFDQILAERQSGKGWGQIANEHNLRLGDVVSQTKRNANAVEASRRNEERAAARGKGPGQKPGQAHGAGPVGTAAGHAAPAPKRGKP